VIEWSHRLVAALVSVLVVALALYGVRKSRAAFVAVGLLVLQILLGAITVKLELPAWTVILHLGTAMLLLATLLIIATGSRSSLNPQSWLLVLLSFITVLFGALTANLGAAAACHGFPLCNGQVWITAGPLALIQWVHRLLAYSLAIVAVGWAVRSRSPAAGTVIGLVALQVTIGAATVLLGLPSALQVAHVAVGTAVWATVVFAVVARGASASTPGSSESHRVFDGLGSE
jgi:heme A synthase